METKHRWTAQNIKRHQYHHGGLSFYVNQSESLNFLCPPDFSAWQPYANELKFNQSPLFDYVL